MNEAWFWAHVDKTGDCWLWTGWRNRRGYGQFYRRGQRPSRSLYAHRVSWELHNGAIPPGLFVCHHRDNPPCVNPAHIFIGTIRDNHVDMVRKGRQPRGETSSSAKLAASQVRQIREQLAAGVSHRRLAARYGVTQPAISLIGTGKTWRHLAAA